MLSRTFYSKARKDKLVNRPAAKPEKRKNQIRQSFFSEIFFAIKIQILTGYQNPVKKRREMKKSSNR